MSTLATTNIKHPSSASNNIVLDSSGNVVLQAGSASTPALQPSGDTNTGIFFPAADTIAFAEGGVESARIDSSGRLLVGTSTSIAGKQSQQRTVQIAKAQASTDQGLAVFHFDNGGQPPNFELGLSKNNTLGSHTAVVSGDNCGNIQWSGSDGTKFVQLAQISGVVDGTPGSDDMPGRLVFSTTADGASSPTARFRIDNQGRQSMLSADYVLNLRSESAASGSIEALYVARSATTLDNGTGVFAVYTNGTYATLSDQTQKKNIETTRDGYLDDLNKLRVVKYNWNEQQDDEPKELGLIAQEVEQVFPGLITEMKSGEGEDETTNKGVKAGVLPYMLLKALQEATARIETLEAEVAALKGV